MLGEEGGVGDHLGELEPRFDLFFGGRVRKVERGGVDDGALELSGGATADARLQLLRDESLAFDVLDVREGLQSSKAIRRCLLLGREQDAEHGATALDGAGVEVERFQMELGDVAQGEGAAEQVADGVEPDLEIAEGANELEPRAVVGVVQTIAAGALGARGEQAERVVVAQRLDADVHLAGELADGPVLVGHGLTLQRL